MLATVAPPPAVPVPHPSVPHPSVPPPLDPDRLRDAVAERRGALAELELAMVAACEEAAFRAAPAPGVLRHDRGTWDRATWDRYIAAAAAAEPRFGPPIRRLHEDIARLDRLAALGGAR